MKCPSESGVSVVSLASFDCMTAGCHKSKKAAIDRGLFDFRRGILFRQRSAELFDAIESFFDIRHARCIADPDVIVRAERDAGHGGDFLLLEQFLAEFGRLQAGLGDVREEIKRASGVYARQAGNRNQFGVRLAKACVALAPRLVCRSL